MENKHLLKLLDLTADEITEILDLADQLKYDLKHHRPHRHLEGKSLAMIFEKQSTRTRVSFEVGMFQLGGHALFLDSSVSQMGRGEAVEDTARALSRYCDGIMIRTFRQDEVETLASIGDVPVINGMTDFAHPCQVLADLMTIRERKAILSGLKAAYIGDGDNMCNSLIVGCLKMGMQMHIACPPGYDPSPAVLDFAASFPDHFRLFRNPQQAVAGADVVFTDTWVSMGKEREQYQRRADLAPYQLNAPLLSLANPGCMVQHCLPAYKGQEITADVFESHAAEIFDETENRLHAQKAVLTLLLGDKT